MRNLKKSNIAKVISVIFILFLIIGMCSLIFLPCLYDTFKEPNVKLFKEHTVAYQVAFYSCYVLTLGIVYKLAGLFECVYKGSPFNKRVEKDLKVSAILFMLIFIIIIIKTIFIPTLLSFAVAFVCFVASLSFYVLSEVIKAAIQYKNEIDYTV